MEPNVYFLDSWFDSSYPQSIGTSQEWFSCGKHLTGTYAWSFHIHLQLKKIGYETHMTTKAPEDGILIGHIQEISKVSKGPQVLSVSARSDRTYEYCSDISDYEIVQNKHHSNERCFYIPHIPQPWLIPRDKSRGDTFENAAYVGFSSNCHRDMLQSRWKNNVASMGLIWTEMGAPWCNYHDIDVIVAIRQGTHTAYYEKPATKLINAWQARVPAILGPESAYQDLRESELDYLEARTIEEVAEHLKRLKADKPLRRAMVENGRKRFPEYSFEATAKKWAALIERLKDAYKERSGLFIDYKSERIQRSKVRVGARVVKGNGL